MQARRTTESFNRATVGNGWGGFSDEQMASGLFLVPLRGLVYGLVHDANLHEDFLQEAATHFLGLVVASPGRTLSWYLQGCYYHIRNLLQRGSSIDSLKRAH